MAVCGRSSACPSVGCILSQPGTNCQPQNEQPEHLFMKTALFEHFDHFLFSCFIFIVHLYTITNFSFSQKSQSFPRKNNYFLIKKERHDPDHAVLLQAVSCFICLKVLFSGHKIRRLMAFATANSSSWPINAKIASCSSAKQSVSCEVCSGSPKPGVWMP